MKRIVWTPRAAHDLQSIRGFIEQDSQHYDSFERLSDCLDFLNPAESFLRFKMRDFEK